MLTGREELRKICILRDGSVLLDDKCDDAEDVVWRYVFSVHSYCRSLFSFSVGNVVKAVFLYIFGGGGVLRHFCMATGKDFVESFSPET